MNSVPRGRSLERVREYCNLGVKVAFARSGHDAAFFFRKTLQVIDDPNTKRIVLDARQAAVFAEVDETPPEHVQSKLELPFEQFYVELTEPVRIGTPEAHYEDHVFAFMCWQNGEIEGVPAYMLAFFYEFENEDGKIEVGDHEFTVNIKTGDCWVTKAACMAKWTLYRESLEVRTRKSSLPESLGWHTPFIAGSFFPEMSMREIGWWEEYVVEMNAFFSWFLSYVMSKSIRISRIGGKPEKPTRKGKKKWVKRRPVPWHAVTVEPSFGSSHETGTSGSEHGYRYDVIGHLRFGRHKCKDGTYTRSIEWVKPHQRGLKNSLYVPKTYRVKRGRTIAKKEMEQYFKK